jgi:UDP-N-acetyl-D-galactosamine dehydrogenase
VINSGRFVNDSMGFYVAKQAVKKMINAKKNISDCKVLVMGLTFKEDVSDIRNSRVPDIITELKSYAVNVDVMDPLADNEEVKKEYGFELISSITNKYDAVIVAVNHLKYKNLNEDFFKSITTQNAILIDVKGIYRNKIKHLNYWSL